MLSEFKDNKNATETAKKISKFMVKLSLPTTKSESGF